MKIICESCGAKYSIADEKVAGKVFKIRCKKCSEVIVVRGDQPEDAEEETRVFDYGSDASWHVVVDGDQQGPMTPGQIGELLAEGKIDWEAYVWKEGFDNWQPAKDVEPLVAAIMAESDGGGDASAAAAASQEAAPAAAAAVAASSDDGFGGSSDMGDDPFADHGDDGGLSGLVEPPVASASAAGGAADLFAGADPGEDFSGGPADEEPSAALASSARVSEADAMTGQRNENSVLFSLSNLQALATSSGSSPPPASDHRPGMAQGEGSGLIDIRALASANQSLKDKESTDQAASDNVESLLAVGGGGSTFSAAAIAAPVAAEKPESGNKLVLGLVAALGVLVLALGAVVVVVLLKDDPAPVAAAAAGEGQANPAAASAAALPATTGAAEAAKPAAEPEAADEDEDTEDEQEKVAAADEGEDDGDDSHSRSRRKRRAKRSGSSSSSAKAADPAPSKPEPAPAAKPKRASGDIDDLLSAALGGGGGAKAKRASRSKSSDSNLPDSPDRNSVKNALQSVAGAVKACGGGQSGVAMTKVTVAGKTGRVTNAVVSGSFAGTPVGSCVAKKVRRAKFPRFKSSTFSVSYPYRL